jgi:serine/threonine-protein kinase
MLLAACMGSLALSIGAAVWTLLVPRVEFAGSPEVLRAKARTVLAELGYTAAPRDSAWWWVRDNAQLDYLARTGPIRARAASAASAVPSPLGFQYRQGPRHIVPQNAEGAVAADSPPLEESDALVQLDAAGRLTYLRVVPPAVDAPESGDGREPDWSALVAFAGLRGVALADAAPRWAPPSAADQRRAWTAAPNGEPLRLEAAAYRGRIVFARLGGAWNDAGPAESAGTGGGSQGPVADLADAVMPILWIAIAASVAWLARRHVRLGRGDRRGALRVAAFVGGVGAAADLAARHWAFDAGSIWFAISRYQGRALFSAGLVWLCYLGLEPFVRRSAPHLIVGWTRLIGGQWRDPLVGQGLLAGVVLGLLWPVMATLPLVAGPMLGLEGAQLRLNVATLAPLPMYLSTIAWSVLNGVINALALVAFMVTSRFVLRGPTGVAVATAAVTTLAAIMGVRPFALDLAQAAVIGIVAVWFIRRFGLLALVTALAVNWSIRATPWTIDPSDWFVWRAGLTAALIAGLAVWGFLNVLGRQSPLPAANFD